MATTVSLTKVTITGDRHVFTFADGTGLEFPTAQAVAEFLDSFDDPGASGKDNARLMCLAYLKKRSSDFSNPNSVLNKDFTLDLGHAQVVRIT